MTALTTSFKRIGIVAAFAIAAMLPVYLFGLPSGNDQAQHYQFAWTVHSSLTSGGDVYPSFAADTNRGFGDYGLRFYPPLTYYVLAGLRVVTGDWFFASMIALTLVFFVGGLGVYKFARDLFGEREALIAAAIYTVIPYHLNEVYNNYLLAEFFATAVLPWCFVYLHRGLREPLLKNALPLAISTSFLVLTHLPLTLIGGIAMAFYAVVSLRKEGLARQVAFLGLAGLLTAAMTAFYWSRWLPELAWITHNTERYFSTTWDYRTNFLLLPSHWTGLADDVLNLWFADLMLTAAVLIAVPFVAIAARDRESRSKLLPLITVLSVATVMTTPLSKPLWDNLIFLQKVQFPWRWLAVASLFAAVLGAAGITRVLQAATPSKSPLLPAVLALALAFVAFMAVLIIRTPVYITHAQLNAEIATFDDSTGCDCWWPIWARPGAFAQKEEVVVPGRAVTVTYWTPQTRAFAVGAGEPTEAKIKAFYYPRWQAVVNGGAASAVPDENGMLSVTLPPQAADVVLTFIEPSYVKAAAIISLVVWIAILLTSSALLLKSRRTADEPYGLRS